LASSFLTQNPPSRRETAFSHADVLLRNDRPGVTLHPQYMVAERLLTYNLGD
jgi:hypothetical protein